MNEEEVNAIYEEVMAMTMNLDPDPIRYGPESLQDKNASVQNFLSRLERISMNVNHKYHIAQRSRLRKSQILEMRTKDLIANDEHVRSGASIKDRTARAHMILRDEVEEVDALDLMLGDCELVLKVLNTKRNELKNLQQRIKDQFKMVQEEIALGGRWGRPRMGFADVNATDSDAVMKSLAEIDVHISEPGEVSNFEDIFESIPVDEIKNQAEKDNEESDLEDILSSL
jgi:hypothetical protein